ncbi:MAG: small multi-drug export protein [Euryarchaeota archaeon]|nr:small multi-drug export protein [Euryarchaeota archaeon]
MARRVAPDEDKSDLEDRPHDPFDRVEERTEVVWDKAVDRFAHVARLEGHEAWARFLLPLVAIALGALFLILFHPQDPLRMWTFITVYFAPGGIEFGIPAGLALGLDPLWMVAVVLYVDLFGPLWLVWNLDLVYRVPKVGKWFLKLETKAERSWSKRRRLRDLGVVGLGIYVMLPISASGVIPSVILGRILGFPKGLVWLAVFVGSAVRVILYAFLAEQIFDRFF